jgi:glycosyltransferase involved in cell wall biosynthesis
MREPLVTMALQYRNCEATLAAAVRSIALQTLVDWELILHDDGSTDGSAAVAASLHDPRIRLAGTAVRRGRPACINEAVAGARGRYFALMDGDDIAYPERLERQVEYLEQHPEVDLAGAPALVFGAGGIALGKRAVPLAHAEICRRPWSGFPMWQWTFTGKREWFRRHPYDERRMRAQDQDLLLRSHAQSRFANLPDILAGYREERIALGKSLRTRFHLAAAFLREFGRQGRPDLAAWAVAGQCAKGAVDAFAVTSGLGYRVLRHRARPLTGAERSRWNEVWALVTSEVGLGV